MAYGICLNLRALHFSSPRRIMASSICLDLRALPFPPPRRIMACSVFLDLRAQPLRTHLEAGKLLRSLRRSRQICNFPSGRGVSKPEGAL